jgi:hypothetical protein
MKTSVIILHYSGLDDTRACIRSLLADGCADREILVWDNASAMRDGEALCREFGSAVRIEVSSENFGYAGGNNRAAEKAAGDTSMRTALPNSRHSASPSRIADALSQTRISRSAQPSARRERIHARVSSRPL